MATEQSRKESIKTVKSPDGSISIDVPVIDEITFIDANDRYQEITFTFSNYPNNAGDREVHVVTVRDSTGGTSATLDVERIDKFQTIDAESRHQEAWHSPDNVTGEDDSPPHFRTHLKTHVKRLTSGGSYIDTERIDEMVFLDPIDRYQETHYFLGPWNDEQ